MTLNLPDVTINLNSADEDIKSLFTKLKPQWNREKIIVKTLTGGCSCLTCCVYSEDNSDDAYTVRVKKLFQHIENTFLADPEFEIEAIKELSKLSLFPPVIAVFQNGYCYEYIPGKPISVCGTETPEKGNLDRNAVRAMIEKLAEINSVKLENKDYNQTEFLSRLDKLLQNYKATSVDKSVLVNELNEILSYFDQFDLRITLCHGDVHAGNVVYNKEKGKASFVDWEISHIGYQVYDVAYCLQMMHFQDIMPSIPGAPVFPDEKSKEDSRKDILKWYFDKWSELNPVENYDTAFNEFRRQVTYFRLLWHLVFIIILGSFMQDISAEHAAKLPINIHMMALKTFEHYYKMKEKYLSDLNLK